MFNMTARWLLIFCALIHMLCWSESYHDYDYTYEPIWFQIRLLTSMQALGINATEGCAGTILISKHRDFKESNQLWRWYKGMLMNKKSGLVIDVEGSLKEDNQLMLNYPRYLPSQCWTATGMAGAVHYERGGIQHEGGVIQHEGGVIQHEGSAIQHEGGAKHSGNVKLPGGSNKFQTWTKPPNSVKRDSGGKPSSDWKLDTRQHSGHSGRFEFGQFGFGADLSICSREDLKMYVSPGGDDAAILRTRHSQIIFYYPAIDCCQ